MSDKKSFVNQAGMTHKGWYVMPNRIFGKDEILAEAFTAEDLTGPEYEAGHYVAVTCKRCGTRWGLVLGDMGEVAAGARNPLLAHVAAERGNGYKARPMIFKLPKVTP